MVRNIEKPIQTFRFIIQIAFVFLCIWIGYDFYKFVNFLESGGALEFSTRPPGVDGFLPISSMMSLYYFFLTGNIHPAHPAGLVIFFAIIFMSFLIGKSFCSWFCPVGFISEMLANLGDKIFRRKIKMPKFLDYPLRSIKYLLLAFLFYTVFFMMNEIVLKAFLDSPYNLVADVKMYYFFAKISQFSLIVIGVLIVLSIVFRNFWCRYLCPYGALLGFISLFSPAKIKRNTETCTDCKACTKACPSFIKVHKMKSVISDECTSCMSCVDACPVKSTLYFKPVLVKKEINKKIAAGIVISVFLLATGIAMLSGKWQNNVTKEEYLRHFKNIEKLDHMRGGVQ
ncbi:MAG: 4Fe-4S binding protein [Ignavibacteriae bacterium]|nr:4Fe-4S binding protein [Ignavibacteriota bacterium]